jgi:hypothetical protein
VEDQVRKYVVYGRHSGDGQTDGSSKERQLDMGYYRGRVAELERQLGEPIVLFEKPYYDNAKSGFYGDNLEAELGRMFADIRSGEIGVGDIIGTESHSRLGRLEPGEALYQYLDILKIGRCLDIKGNLRTWESINGMTGIGILTQDFIEMFMAWKHSQDLSDAGCKTNRLKIGKVRAGQLEGVMMHRRPGCFVGRRCAAWLTPVSEPMVYDGREFMYRINEEIAEIVRMIFHWADEGIGTRIIARRLTDMGVPPLANAHRTKEPKLDSWSAGMVGALLHNIAVVGLWQPKTRTRDGGRDATGKRIILSYAHKVIDGDPIDYYPPIIAREQFDRIQRRMRARKEAAVGDAYAAGGRKGRGFGNLVYKIGRCGCCENGRLTLWSRTKGNRSGPAKYLRCENSRRSRRKCANIHGFNYGRFESLLLALFHHDMRPLLAALTPKAERDNMPSRARLSDIVSQIDTKKAAHHEYHVELDDLRGDERKAQRQRMAELLSEIAALEADQERLETAIRDSERNHAIDYEERVRAGVARLRAEDEIERENAREALNGMLAERIQVVMHNDRRITVLMQGDRRAGFVTFTSDQIIDAGTLDQDGRRLAQMDDLWLKLARVAMGLENSREREEKFTLMLDEIKSDPNVQQALAVVGNAA